MVGEFFQKSNAKALILTHFGGSEAHGAQAGRLETLGYPEAYVAWLTLTSQQTRSILAKKPIIKWLRRGENNRRKYNFAPHMGTETNAAVTMLPDSISRIFKDLQSYFDKSEVLRSVIEMSQIALESSIYAGDDSLTNTQNRAFEETLKRHFSVPKSIHMYGALHPTSGMSFVDCDSIESRVHATFETFNGVFFGFPMEPSRSGAIMHPSYAFPLVSDRTIMAELTQRVQVASQKKEILCARDYMRVYVPRPNGLIN